MLGNCGVQEVRPVIEKDRDLLARVAVHSPHLAGTVLRLCNDLEDAYQLSELPPGDLLEALGHYVGLLGQLICDLAPKEPSPVVIDG